MNKCEGSMKHENLNGDDLRSRMAAPLRSTLARSPAFTLKPVQPRCLATLTRPTAWRPEVRTATALIQREDKASELLMDGISLPGGERLPRDVHLAAAAICCCRCCWGCDASGIAQRGLQQGLSSPFT